MTIPSPVESIASIDLLLWISINVSNKAFREEHIDN